ncbi:hypothetical protein MBLNU457_6046t1 [Dothideomycetes sp. NU457]
MDSKITPAALLLDLPPQALGGIDLLAFTTTPRFRGVKNLPPGLHFIFAGSTSALSERHGIWFYIKPASDTPPDLVIHKWDPQTETLVTETSEAEILRHRANLGSIWREGLTPYRQTATKDAPQTTADRAAVQENTSWPQLCSYITPELLTQVLGTSWSMSSSSSAAIDLDSIPDIPSSLTSSTIPAEKLLRYLPIDLKRTWAPTATGRERTDAARDRSWYLCSLLATHRSSTTTTTPSSNPPIPTQAQQNHLLAELQLTHLTTLTLSNPSSLSQYKRLLTLLLTSYNLTTTCPSLFTSLFSLLQTQLSSTSTTAEAGGLLDLSDDEDAGFFRELLVRFKKNISSLPRPNDDAGVEATESVLDALEECQEWCRRRFGWRFEEADGLARLGGEEGMRDQYGEEVGPELESGLEEYDEMDERGEWAPVVLELTESQRRMIGVDGDGVGDGQDGEDGRGDDEEEEEQVDEEEEVDLEDMDARY